MMKDLKIEAYLTPGTIRALDVEAYELNGSTIVPIAAGTAFTFGDVEVTPFRVPHDASDPVAFSVRCGGIRITQLTDIGHMPDSVAQYLRESDVLILESNHDLEMLRVGPYPFSLKQRLMGRFGHLSNTAVAKFIRDQYDGRASHIVLAHLSSKNNHPELARQETIGALRHRGFSYTPVTVTKQNEAGIPICLS
jgi:phosphoribosyl 1,2-cyclic phosphodiesterase